MEAVRDILHILIMFGIKGLLVVGGVIYAFYALESHCVNPMGCRPSAADEYQATRNDQILACWNHTDQLRRDCLAKVK